MSVITDVYLPDQPAVGESTIVPLGGDGYTAPQSMLYAEASSTGDASGGTNRIRFRFEEVHSHMLAWLAVQVDGQTANSRSLVNLVWGSRGENLPDSISLPYTPEGGANEGYGLWRPPPLIFEPAPRDPTQMTAPFVEAYVLNSNGVVLKVGMCAYQFRTNTRSTTPFPLLAANFPS